MKTMIFSLMLGSTLAFAGNCITVDASGKRVVVDCATLSSSGAENTRDQRQEQIKLDSAAYQEDLDARIQERLRNMNQSDAEKVQKTIDAARTRTEQRKADFINNK